MPQAAPRPCTYPGCGVLVRDGTGRCETHRRVERQRYDAQRGSAHERGYTGAWQKAREAWLRAHPLCRKHEDKGEVVAASVVDHIIPHKGDKVLFWDSKNWQSLCKPCHDHKTATEDSNFTRWQT